MDAALQPFSNTAAVATSREKIKEKLLLVIQGFVFSKFTLLPTDGGAK